MSWIWLTFWRGRRENTLVHWRVVLYTRVGCHLCEDAWTQLEKARARHGFALTKVDVDTDVSLAARFGLEVPVIEVNGKVRFRGIVNAVLLQRLFDAQSV
jgi:hypothetical protein